MGSSCLFSGAWVDSDLFLPLFYGFYDLRLQGANLHHNGLVVLLVAQWKRTRNTEETS